MGRESDARERLLAAALELVWERSYHSVGVEAICAKAGVKKGSFYHFFASKADLVAQAATEHWRAGRAELDALFSSPSPPLARLKAFCDKVYTGQCEHRRLTGKVRGCPYFDLASESGCLEPELAGRLAGILHEYRRRLREAACEAKSLGHIAAPDPEAAADRLFDYLQGSLMNARISGDPEPLRELWTGAKLLLGAPDPFGQA